MQIPRKEKWTKEDMIEYIKTCAKQYVPEWRYSQENPDAGTALVSLFADMMCDTVKRFNLSAVGDMFSFFDEVNAKMLPAKPAEGFITFGLPKGFEGEEEVLRGTKLLAETEEEPVIFETQEEVLVRQMSLKNIYLSNPLEDTIYQVYNQQQEAIPSFFLFQNKGRNLQQHKIIFCFSHGLEIQTDAKAKLSFQITGKNIKNQEWEHALQEEESIYFSYGTAKGYQSIEKEYEENAIYFDIIGGENGISVKEEFQSSYIIQAEILDAELFSKIYFSSLTLSISSQNRKPDFIHVNGIDQEMEDFLVFGRTPSIYDEFYIVSEEVFGKIGAQIQIEFDLDFVKIPLELATEKKISWKTIMKKRDFIPEQEYDISICEVVWEYYNGYGWTRLIEGNTYKYLFTPEENLRGQRVRMEFTCPSDINRVLVNAAETYALRARVLRMNNAYKSRGDYIAPVAGRVSLSYHYDKNPLRPIQIIKWNNLEKQMISKEEMQQEGFSTAFCDKIKDRKTACYLGFEQPFIGGPLKLLFVMQDTMQQNMPMIEWEYWGKNGWKTIHPIDGTKGFHHTGIVSWIGNSDVQRKVLFEQNLFWIRLIDTENAYKKKSRKEKCPKIEGIYPNSTKILGIETREEFYKIAPYAQEKKIKLPFINIVNIQVWVLECIPSGSSHDGHSAVLQGMDYQQDSIQQVWEKWKEVEELEKESSEKRQFVIDRQTGIITFPKYMNRSFFHHQDEISVRVQYEHCQGEKGNLKVGAINRLDRSIGYINNSYNPVVSVGGVSKEKVLDAVKRNAQTLRHGYRCVAAKDYEDMAWEATRNISKIKCFSGYDQEGKRKPGAITLVVLPKEYQESSYSFEKMKMQIYEYLSKHMDENILYLGNFYIVKPELIRLDVKTTIEFLEEKEIFLTRKKILEELERFLNPLNGNFYGEGWEIGTIPNQNQIIHTLKKIEGVKNVKQLTLRKFCQGSFEELEINEESELPFYLLPKSGTHEIQIELQV